MSSGIKRVLVGLSRFELLTSSMSRMRSNQLSYSPIEKECEIPRGAYYSKSSCVKQ